MKFGTKRYTIYMGKTAWHREIAFDFHPTVKDEIKACPGVYWNPENKRWGVPIDCLSIVYGIFEKYGFKSMEDT